MNTPSVSTPTRSQTIPSTSTSTKQTGVVSRGKQVVALDCEMVGVGTNGSRSALARVVVVDGAGRVVLDEHVKPKEKVTDFRTKVSGVTRADLTTSCIGFSEANASVASLIKDKVLVGHGLENDLKALMLSHPMRDTRDSALYPPLLGNWKARYGGARKLKDLAKQHLDRCIQVEGAPHDPAEDARSALDLYKKFAKDWDAWSVKNSRKARQRLNRRRYVRTCTVHTYIHTYI